MNKALLVEKIAEKNSMTKADAERVVETLIDEIITTVSKKEEVTIAGFGIFESKKRAARTGRNPRTGETIKIAESWNPKFRAAKAFKDAVK